MTNRTDRKWWGSRAGAAKAAALVVASIMVIVTGPSGCVERTISITSDPSGALVFVNDEEVGRTPCDLDFLYYGTYDVRLVKDGFEPYMGPAEAKAPAHDMVGVDLLAEMAPVRFESRVKWHFVLRPVDTTTAAVTDRARQLRAKLGPAAKGSEGGVAPAPTGDQGGSGTENPSKP